MKVSEEIEFQYEVRQGCILLSIHFLLVSGNVFHAALVRRPGEGQWTMSSFLKHLSYADDMCLLSYRAMDLNQMWLWIGRKRQHSRTENKHHQNNVLSLTGHRICINGQTIGCVKQLAYLFSLVSADVIERRT